MRTVHWPHQDGAAHCSVLSSESVSAMMARSAWMYFQVSAAFMA